MDVRKRSLAPIGDHAWGFLEETARDVISANLSARRVVDVAGPLGWDHAAVSLGRLSLPSNAKQIATPEAGAASEVGFGVRMVKPLVESRVAFTLSQWEMDNIARGALDADVSALEEAAKRIAVFEERAVYEGLELGSIEGLDQVAEHRTKPSGDSLVGAIAAAVDTLRRASVDGPYNVVLPTDQWQRLIESCRGYPPEKQIRSVTDGEVVASPNVEKLYVVSARGGDLELTLGQDFTLGFSRADGETVTLELFESFSFRVLEPAAYVIVSA
ncbi:MAG: family 1 encapsulin nanocompartment shell protein [bacterium]